ncbi:MAG TPA: ABC transporter substrate-binding protein [Chloroflexota bacterium]|jgi:NitT/TauT family transport system substrate-binding protein|nr:ABC transporter substrate-binding protein [Chloroflexota bacterium]
MGHPRLAALLCAVTALVGCQAAPPAASTSPAPVGQASKPSASPAAAGPAPATTLVQIGVTGSVADAPLYIAQERGYFREAGVTTELVQLDSGARMVPALSTGQLQVGGGAPSLGLFRSIQRELPLVIVADRVQSRPGYPASFLVVRTDVVEQLRTFADLRGRRIAVTAAGSTPYVDAVKALALGGLRREDAELVELGFPDMPAALAGGAVEVATVAEPFRTVAVQQQFGVAWKDSEDYNPGEQASVLLFSPPFARDNPDLANRFMVAYLRGVRDFYRAFIERDPAVRPAILQLLSRTTSLKDPNVWEALVPSWIDPDGRVNQRALDELIDFFVADGSLPGRQGLDGIVDHRFVDSAVAQLGPYAPAAR